MMAETSPLLLELNENDPGIFVTQSVHKQQAGFSQTSQIHKKITIFAARRVSARTSG
jgi:ornithine decarboxylase